MLSLLIWCFKGSDQHNIYVTHNNNHELLKVIPEDLFPFFYTSTKLHKQKLRFNFHQTKTQISGDSGASVLLTVVFMEFGEREEEQSL